MGLNPGIELSKSVEAMQIQYVRPYHREIARRLVVGEKASSIALDMGLDVGRLSIIINSPLFQLELKRMEDMRDSSMTDVAKTLTHLAPVALELCERTMYKTKDDKLRSQIAWDILDRAGYKPKNVVDINNTHRLDLGDLSKDEKKKIIQQRIQGMRDKETEFRAELDAAEDRCIDVEATTEDVI